MGDYKQKSDAELVAATLNGVTEAYSELVMRHGAVVFGVIHRLVRDYHECEDLTQQTLLDGFMQLYSLREPDKVSSWLCGIAKRKALHHLSRRRYHDDIDTLCDVLFDEEYSPDAALLSDERKKEIRAAVDALPEKQRQAARMFYINGESVQGISLKLGTPMGTVKRRLYDARENLKEKLSYMNEEKFEITGGFMDALNEKLNSLREYYFNHGYSHDGFKETADATMSMLEKLPESKEKQNKLASLYYYMKYAGVLDKSKSEDLHTSALAGQNAEALYAYYIDKALDNRDNYKAWLEVIDNEAVPALKALGYNTGVGGMLFWRGNAEIGLEHAEKAYESFKEAKALCDKSSIEYAMAVSAVDCYEFFAENADDICKSFNVTAESYYYADGKKKLYFKNQPGFGSSIMYTKHKYDYLNYFVSRFKGGIFFDTDMTEGEIYRNVQGGELLKVISYHDTVTVGAGTFTDCMHLYYGENEFSADIFYAPGVGMVKVYFDDMTDAEIYELSEYDIKGGEGYFPFAEGNRLVYVNHALPDYLCARFENICTYTDGTNANFAVNHFVAFKKGYLLSETLDGEVAIELADTAAIAWELDKACDYLQKAVRANTSAETTSVSLAALEYLERVRDYKAKNYRFCPSSYNGNHMSKNDGNIVYNESGYNLSPYRFGSRFEENRIFGVKLLRFLENLAGCVWSDKWVVGYTSRTLNTVYGEYVDLSVSDGGTVTTPAGTFEGCLKVTIEAEKQGMSGGYYFEDNYSNVWCGKKEFWFARGVGIVRFDCTWGDTLSSSSVLAGYKNPAGGDDYLPVYIGCAWEYDEVNLTAEGYRAKRIMEVACGLNDRFLIHDIQDFLYLGTEDEYEAFKKSLAK